MPASTPPPAPPAADPREAEEWFQRLPAKVQDDVRQHWRMRQRVDAEYAVTSRTGGRARQKECALLLAAALFVANVFCVGAGRLLLILLAAAGAGAAVGHLAHWRALGRFGYALAGLLAFLAVQGALSGMSARDLGGVLFFFMGLLFTAYGFAAYGVHREFTSPER